MPVMQMPVREIDLVQMIRTALEYKGYTVFRTNQWRGDKAGSDPGVPDLLVRKKDWVPGTLLGIEVKTPKGRLSQTQKWVETIGGMIVVRSVEDALKALGEKV